MTETPRPPVLVWTETHRETLLHAEVFIAPDVRKAILAAIAHIDALTAEVAALDRDYGELLKSMTAELQEARAERDKANSLYQMTLGLLEVVTGEKTEPRR